MSTNKKILVTGATGFVGGKLTKLLLQKNHEVYILARNKVKAKPLVELGAKLIDQDLSEEFSLKESFDVIFHAAALSSTWGKYEDFYKANVIATQNLIRAAKASSSQLFVHISSPSLYFNFKDRFEILESDCFGNDYVNHYVETKKLAEEVIRNEAGELSFIILRPRGIFGPGDTSIMPRILRIARRGFMAVPNPKAIIDLTYIDNLLDAMLLCINPKPEAYNRIFNISNSEKLTIQEILEILFLKLNLKVKIIQIPFCFLYSYAFIQECIAKLWTKSGEPEITRYSAGILSKSLTLNINAAKKYLGYQPRTTIREGLEEYTNWLKSQQK